MKLLDNQAGHVEHLDHHTGYHMDPVKLLDHYEGSVKPKDNCADL